GRSSGSLPCARSRLPFERSNQHFQPEPNKALQGSARFNRGGRGSIVRRDSRPSRWIFQLKPEATLISEKLCIPEKLWLPPSGGRSGDSGAVKTSSRPVAVSCVSQVPRCRHCRTAVTCRVPEPLQRLHLRTCRSLKTSRYSRRKPRPFPFP